MVEKVRQQSKTLKKRMTIRLTDEQYKNWDKKIHPELVRYILDNNIGMEDMKFIKDLFEGF